MAVTPETTDGRDTVSIPITDQTSKSGTRLVVLREPTEGQWQTIIRIPSLIGAGSPVSLDKVMVLFCEVVDSLFVKEDDLVFVLTALARGELAATDYYQIAVDLIKHFGKEPAPAAGPPITTRRRVAARKPAKR